MTQRRSVTWLLLMALLLPILAACGGGGQPAASTPATGASTAPASAPAESPAAEPSEAASEAAEASPDTATGGEASPEASEAAEEGEASPAADTGAITVPDVEGLADLSGQSIQVVLGADGPGAAYDDAAAAKFEELTGAEVEVIRGDQSATDRLSTYLQQLTAGAGPDVLQIDVIWPGILADYAYDLSSSIPDIDQYFPAIVENNTVDGKLVGVPWFTDAGLLYYRTDLLEKYGFDGPPETWTELEEMANTIQEGERGEGRNDFWGFVWQGNAYEGLTCNGLEWQVSNGGGQIVEGSQDAPEITINNPQTIAAFERARGWVGTISPDGVTTYDEPTSLGVWQAGNAAFMRNWPYAIAETQGTDFADSFDVGVLPTGDGEGARNAATLGGWQLMVNQASDSPEAGAEFVKFMTSPEMQEFWSINRTLLPTRPAVYEDADVLEVNPYYESLLPVFSGGAVPRPSTVTGDLYNDVSVAYFTGLNQILTGQVSAEEGVAQIEEELQVILE
jgi:trehalose/maltose transport system substrate-binding protein